MTPTSKVCSRCDTDKPLDEFSRQKLGKHGRRADCKVCQKTYNSMWKSENKDRSRAVDHANYVANREARLAYNRAWNKAHPESVAKALRDYRDRCAAEAASIGKPRTSRQLSMPLGRTMRTRKTPEERKAVKRAWVLANPDKVQPHKRTEYLRNAQAISERVTRWQKANPMMRRAQTHKRLALKAGAAGARYTTATHIEARWALYGYRCYYCGAVATSTDHRIPLARGGSHWPSNLVPCCKTCNSRKHARTEKQFKEVIAHYHS